MKTNLQNIKTLEKTLANVLSTSPRSYWGKGVQKYAVSMLYDAIDRARRDFEDNVTTTDVTSVKYFLNGAGSWAQYSAGCCALVANCDIAERLCTPSELKRLTYADGGVKSPNKSETWLDVQARALVQAWDMIRDNMPK